MARKPSKPGESAGNGGAKPRTPRTRRADASVSGGGVNASVGKPRLAPDSLTSKPSAPKPGASMPTPSKPASRPRGTGFLHATGAIAPLAQIERLRTFRPPMRAGDSITSEVERFARELAKHDHAAGGLARAWASLAPQTIQQVTRVDRLHGGVLTVVASDASAKYDAEMWLAEGGLAALRGVAARTLRRVKVTIG